MTALPWHVIFGTSDLYYLQVRDGRSALWVHVVDDDGSHRAIRGLSGSGTLHIRHYGRHGQSDIYLPRATN
jgi:hypothetical protein